MPEYITIAEKYLTEKNIVCKKSLGRTVQNEAMTRIWIGTTPKIVYGMFGSPGPDIGYGRLQYCVLTKFGRGELPGALLACNSFNAAGRWVRWGVNPKGDLLLCAYTDLTEETAAEGFFRQVRGMQIAIGLGVPEVKAAARRRPFKTGAEYAAAFACAEEKDAASPAGEASLYADELEEYIKKTEYIASREDECTLKVRLDCGVFADVSFRGNGDTRILCRVQRGVSEEQTARALLACNRLNVQENTAFYLAGTGEIFMRRDMFMLPGTVGEQCARQFKDMPTLYRKARDVIGPMPQ